MKTQARQFLLAVFLSLVLSSGRAFADALVITEAMKATTIAEVFIEGDTVRVELEIGASDILAFANLMPDEIYQKLGEGERPLDERLAEFFSNDWVLKADGGEPLSGRPRGIVPKPRLLRDKITGDPLPTPDGQKPEIVLSAKIDYQLPAQPSSLSLSPPRSENGAAATVGFVVYHEGVAVNDFRYLGREETLDLDWEDPWYSAFRNRNLKRKFSDPAQGFIYVEPFEIRKEILIRPQDLQNWVDLGLEGKQIIAAADQEALKEKVASFLGERYPMTVDGEPVEFDFDRIHFVRRSLRQTTVVDEPVDMPLVSAMLGVICVHRRDGLPKEVAMAWDLFNDKITSIAGAGFLLLP